MSGVVTAKGKDVIAVPMGYYEEFRRDPHDALLKYGSLPQRARSPWFTDVEAIERALDQPDMVVGEGAKEKDPKAPAKSLIGGREPESLLSGISANFGAWDEALWHVHVDLALHKKRQGDAAGIAMGRIADLYVEQANDPRLGNYERIVRNYEVPLVAQIIAPVGDQVYISSIVRFILMLKQVRGFKITSFSFDGWNSADAMQQLMRAGLVTAGMHIDDDTGELVGLPRPFSVDGTSTQPYRELLEVINDDRIHLPKYGILSRELKQLETTEPGLAPDHPTGGSKDTSDAVAGVVGYLAAFGHAIMFDPSDVQVDRHDLEEAELVKPARDFNLEDEPSVVRGGGFNEGLDTMPLDLGV